ncbi:hotdog domain-containing protein [Pseudonocardia sp. CA-107938]|uniref:PaaI family thioesterase n=1 Tax=Pseudonocardia sp. CA-107938 TaxID=3240021 RepID=UPI003D8D3658
MLPRDRLHATVTGDAPIAAAINTFGIELLQVEHGRVTAGLAAVPAVGVHGPGAVLVLADYALTTSVFSTMTVDRQLSTLTLQFSEFGPPAGPGTEVIAAAQAMPVGTDAAVGTIELVRSDGVPLARATGRCALFSPTPGWGEQRNARGDTVTGFADLHATSAADGLATAVVAAPTFANSAGVLHGGVAAAVIADALASGLDAVAPRLAGAPTDYDVTFLRGLPADGARVTTRTAPVRVGARFAVVRTELHDAAGRLAVIGTASRWRG